MKRKKEDKEKEKRKKKYDLHKITSIEDKSASAVRLRAQVCVQVWRQWGGRATSTSLCASGDTTCRSRRDGKLTNSLWAKDLLLCTLPWVLVLPSKEHGGSAAAHMQFDSLSDSPARG